MMKKFDKLLILSFIPPFIATFFIALFVFVMQTLWLYIDDIAGKGVGFFLMVELVSYLSVSMIPMALPVAVLISSVMVMGNLAENYELSSIKSAGVSLWRTMRPLMYASIGIGIFSFFCSNYFIPVSNLKFKSRLYDIRQQKPALSLEESLFNQDFQGFSIRLGEKLANGRSIRNVLIYDNTEASQGRLHLVAADSGAMYGSADNKFFVMELYEGHQYMEPKPVIKEGRRNYPLMRANFRQWTKIFDLSEFQLDRTDESLFKSHYTMLSNRQLLVAIDSIDAEIARKIERQSRTNDQYFYFWEKEPRRLEMEKNQKETAERRARLIAERDSLRNLERKDSALNSMPVAPTNDSLKNVIAANSDSTNLPRTNSAAPTISKNFLLKTDPPPPVITSNRPALVPTMPWQQTINRELKNYDSFLELFETDKQKEMVDRTTSTARSLRDQATTTLASLEKTRQSRVKHVFEFNTKFSLAVACFIFLFIGAPMGAIVRKGGFGWPLLISIIFFMVFFIITTFSKSIAERDVINDVLASWMNCLILFPMGLLLTNWAMKDMNMSQLFDRFRFKVSLYFSNNKNAKA